MEINNHIDNIHHHKVDAIKAIKSGWRHIMRSPFLYIAATFLFLIVSAVVGSTPIVSDFVSVFVTMVVIKLLLDKYEGRNANVNFTFMEYVRFFLAQFMLGVAAILIFIIMAMSTLYPIYNITVADKDGFVTDFKALMNEDDQYDKYEKMNEMSMFKGMEYNDYSPEEIDLTKYFEIKGNEQAVSLFLIAFLIEFCAFIYVIFRVSLVQWLMIDKASGPIKAFKQSWNLTRNNVTQLSVIAILSGFIIIAGFLVLIVGVLFAIPLIYMINLDAYKQMIGESK